MIFLFRTFLRLFFSSKTTHVLVAFQNTNELRSTGGYITQLLDIALGKWRIRKTFRDVNTDIVSSSDKAPPSAMKRLLKVQNVQFRDANYSPDFRISAERMTRIYQSSYSNHKVSIVLAVNFTLLEKILEVLGPVHVDGRAWTADNVFSTMTAHVSNIDLHDRDERSARKDVLRQLFRALIRACVFRFWRWPKLWYCLEDAVKSRDIQLHALDESLQNKFLQRGLVQPFSSDSIDFLAVIDNNYLGVKSNRYIQRRVVHSVRFDFDEQRKKLGDAHVRVRLSFDHTGVVNYPLSSVYQSHVSFWIPADALDVQVLTPHTHWDKSHENEFTVLGVDNVIEPGQHRTFEIGYRLPARLFEEDRYSFTFRAQAGVTDQMIFDSVTFPVQFYAKSTSKALNVKENTASFSSSSDFHSDLQAIKSADRPRIFFHEIVSPQLIEVRFSEPVYAASGSNIATVQHKESGSPVHVSKTELVDDNRKLLIHTANMPDTTEAFYIVQLSSLANSLGTSLADRPRRVTVVYRPRHFRR